MALALASPNPVPGVPDLGRATAIVLFEDTIPLLVAHAGTAIHHVNDDSRSREFRRHGER